MLFRILGPLEVRTGQGWSAVGAPKWRELLAILLLGQDKVLSTDRLVDELWSGTPPTGARKLVNLYVLRLRRLIGDPEGKVLVTRTPGYLLRLGPHDTDVRVFEEGVIAGRTALRADQPERAAELLTDALALWRGPALCDVTLPLATAEARHLDESHLAARELRMDAELACGQYSDVINELRRLVDANPLRERFWGQLIRALHGAHRQAEALETYAQARHVIADELGTDPGRELQDLYHALLGGKSLAVANPAATLRTTAAKITPPICQLPPDVADFTGRSDYTTELIRLLTPTEGSTFVPIAAICGLPGVGKTSLALHAAHSMRDSFPDGQLYVQLAGASPRPRDSGETLGEMLRALGVPPLAIPETTGERTALLRSRLAGRRVLLVADDAATPAQVQALTPGTAGTAVIVTSRTWLTALAGASMFNSIC